MTLINSIYLPDRFRKHLPKMRSRVRPTIRSCLIRIPSTINSKNAIKVFCRHSNEKTIALYLIMGMTIKRWQRKHQVSVIGETETICEFQGTRGRMVYTIPHMALLFLKRLNDSFEENAENLVKQGKSRNEAYENKVEIKITYLKDSSISRQLTTSQVGKLWRHD